MPISDRPVPAPLPFSEGFTGSPSVDTKTGLPARSAYSSTVAGAPSRTTPFNARTNSGAWFAGVLIGLLSVPLIL
jgi:hypothetical protein